MQDTSVEREPSLVLSSHLPPSISAGQLERVRQPSKPLSRFHRTAIAVLALCRLRQRRIASVLNTSPTTVSKWCRRIKADQLVSDASGKGAKRKEPEASTAIVEHAQKVVFCTPKKIKHTLNLSVSARTVRRRLDEAGLHGRVARPTYPFKPAHLTKRLSFVNGYGNWSYMQWNRVLWSDETHIQLQASGQVWCQRPVGKAYDPQYMKTQKAHPESVWGCFSGYFGQGGIHIFRENLDAPLMKTILQTHLLDSAARFPAGMWYFQQDNDPKHRSKLVQEWLFTNGVTVLEWPPYSPDLKPDRGGVGNTQAQGRGQKSKELG